MARLPAQQGQDRRTENDEPQISPLQGSYSVDSDAHHEIFGRISYSMEHLTYGIVHLVQATDVTDREIKMSLLKHHVEVLFTTFPDLKAELYGKGEAHRDDRNLTVRPMIGQIDDSTIAYENESIGIDGTDEPMTVNTSETVNKNGSAVYATNQGTPIQNSSIPLSSRPHLTGNTLVRTPNTAQTQTIGVGTILSSSRGLEPEQVEPHVIQDRPPTKNVTELVSNRTTPDLPVSEVSKVPFVIGHEKGEELG